MWSLPKHKERQMNIGLVGEVRCVVIKEDGTVKEDTGYQKNLILNQGLDFYGDGNGINIFHRCLVGTGNSIPIPTQNKLDIPVKIAAGTSFADKRDYTPREDNLYLVERTYKYLFSTMGNVNISEVGLASNGTSTTNAYMCTRALIKDAMGNPTVISVLNTEKLEVYYKIITVFSTLDTVHQIQYTNAANVTSAYNATVRLALAGAYTPYGVVQFTEPFKPNDTSLYRGSTFRGNIGTVDNEPSNEQDIAETYDLSTYIPGTFKRVVTYNYTLSRANGTTRSIKVLTNIGCWQVQYNSVVDNSPLSKTSKDTMTIPFEVSWGRYEGEL